MILIESILTFFPKITRSGWLSPVCDPMRADMIVVAATLIDFILKLIPIRSITCSHYALKEGAISRLLIAEQTA